MPSNALNKIFYERSLLKENQYQLKNLWITTLFVVLICCVSLLVFIWQYKVFYYKCERAAPESISMPPLIPGSFQDIFELLQVSDLNLCKTWEVIPPPQPEEGENIQDKWRLGNSLCADRFPKILTPSTCKIYSVKYDEDDLTLEYKKGKDGCRVHVWGNKTIYNYMKLGTNTYFYPLDISTVSSPGVYSFDDFLSLLGHEDAKIHYVKSTTNGGHRSLLRAIYSSKSQVWNRIEQIQILVYLPKVTLETWTILEDHYRDLVGLNFLGFKLARSRQDDRKRYTIKYANGQERVFSTLFELVYIKWK